MRRIEGVCAAGGGGHGGPGPGRWWVAVEAAVLLGLAAFLAFSYWSGRLKYYLAPGFLWLSPATAVVLAAMAAARVRAAARRGPACACGEHAGWQIPRPVGVATLLAPVFLALVVHPTGFSSAGRKKRNVPLPARDPKLEAAIDWVAGLDSRQRRSQRVAFSLPPEPTILDLVTAVREGYAEQLEGRFVSVLGECDPAGGGPDGRFDMYRLVVTCCTADASAVAIEVVPAADVTIQRGGWVRGIIKFDSPLDPGLPVVHATTITKIAEPYL